MKKSDPLTHEEVAAAADIFFPHLMRCTVGCLRALRLRTRSNYGVCGKAWSQDTSRETPQRKITSLWIQQR